jgi:hypothetical protein
VTAATSSRLARVSRRCSSTTKKRLPEPAWV